MKNYTSKEIHEVFVAPLMEVISDITQTIKDFEAAVKDGVVEYDFLQLNDREALKAISKIQSWARKEVIPKKEDAIACEIRYKDLKNGGWLPKKKKNKD